MLKRCVFRQSRCAHLQLPRTWRTGTVRFESTAHEKKPSTITPAWKITADQRPPTSRKWHLYVVVGLVGFSIGSWYRIATRSASTDSFTAFELVAKEPVSSTATIFTVKSKEKLPNAEDYEKAWKTGVWNLQFKQPQLQIVRAYTPLPPDNADETETGILRFLIRQDAKGGEMSSYLHRLPLGATLELRGPNIEYPIPNEVKNVIFVAGGTGIAPALQVAHAMFAGIPEEEQAKKTLHILWGNRRREDCTGGVSDEQSELTQSIKAGSPTWTWNVFGSSPSTDRSTATVTTEVPEQNRVIQALNSLKVAYGGHIKVSYFVDGEGSYITSKTLQSAITELPGVRESSAPPQSQIIVSGPPGFITYVAGPKVWQDGEEQQGPLGGRLAQVLGREAVSNLIVWKI